MKNWYENGQLREESTLNEYGKLKGIVKIWHMNGQLSKEATYKDGKPDGVWEDHNEQGELKSKVLYSFGIKVKRENFY